MEESILTSTKKLLGIAEDYPHFDTDIIVHINSVFTVINQLGIGPKEGFAISGKEELWSDFIEYPKMYEMVKTYVYLRVRLLFDPPQSSALIEAINRQVNELEWRLSVIHDEIVKKEGNQNG